MALSANQDMGETHLGITLYWAEPMEPTQRCEHQKIRHKIAMFAKNVISVYAFLRLPSSTEEIEN